MRLFLAINLPASVKRSLSQQLEKLNEDYPHFSWVPQENFHITIHFFWEIGQADVIKKRIEEAVYNVSSFNLYSTGCDLFINQKIVLYVYFRREKKAEELASNINKILQIKDKKKFIPHITIGRYKVPSKQQYLNLRKKLRQLRLEIDFPVTKIYLVQSIMTGKKPTYKKIAAFSLLKKRQS